MERDIQPNEFRYFLTYKSVRTEIVFAPEGWESNSRVEYKRDIKYFGVFRSWGLPLQFVLDGAKILKTAYYQDGIEAGVRIEVEELNHETWQYEIGFVGDIDFSKFNHSKNTVSVTLMESGITRNLKAYSNVKYEFELIGDDVVNVVLPGVAFSEKAESILLPSSGLTNRYIPAIDLVINETNSGFVTVQNVSKQSISDDGFSGSENWFVRGERQTTIVVSGRIKGSAVSPFDQNVTFYIKDNSNQTQAVLYSSPAAAGIFNFDFTFERLIVLEPGEKLFLYSRWSNINQYGTVITEGEFSVKYTSVSDPSNCKGIKSFDLFKRIISRMSPGTAIDSSLLKTEYPNLIFTSGDGIREIPNASIKMSMDDFYNTINGIDDAGLGIDADIFRIEYGYYFARSIQSVNVGSVYDCELSPAEEYMFNSVKIGYDDKNTDETNGKEEYNSGQVWELPITRVQKEENWISPTRADQFGIENLRVNFITKSSTDTSSDNDTFMIDCYQDGSNYRPILGSSYQSITGLSNPSTAYNLRLTPKKNLLRHGSYLHSILDLLDDRYVNFGSGDKNTELTTVIDSLRVKENESFMVSSLPAKYFLPILADIKCKLPRKALQLFDTNPFGYVTFVWEDTIFKGYIIECSVDIARNTEQEFKLLLTPDNNLLRLI